jgi:hypothetical protein
MPKEHSPGKPTTRRYSEQEKEAAVRMVRTLRADLRTDEAPSSALPDSWLRHGVGTAVGAPGRHR